MSGRECARVADPGADELRRALAVVMPDLVVLPLLIKPSECGYLVGAERLGLPSNGRERHRRQLRLRFEVDPDMPGRYLPHSARTVALHPGGVGVGRRSLRCASAHRVVAALGNRDRLRPRSR